VKEKEAGKLIKLGAKKRKAVEKTLGVHGAENLRFVFFLGEYKNDKPMGLRSVNQAGSMKKG